ncbi:3-dehydroquinate synthase [Reinekea sp.]|jgi:3-dehydroquinate synthase|uniref:3-dehydroquinate synthase n=1 Tax=Reinekea sp. TaxID=1970455 RepID=UPI003988E3CD
MKTVSVALGDRSYPIYIGNCFNSPELLVQSLPNQEIMIVTNSTIAPLYLEKIKAPLIEAGKTVDFVILPDGEQYKTLETVNLIFDALLTKPCSRKVALVALGGGVVGDMTGFAAATYQRGVDFLQVPTTLLSQVDSSVGGKTGVNHPLGKNMIGAFKQPLAVFIDPTVLSTLPENEFAAGFAEVIKHGALHDETYLAYLEENLDSILALEHASLIEVISRSCEIKAAVVAQDETEQGVRATLNFGHTFGHAVETTMGYGTYLHGEGVAIGMVMAAYMSAHLGYICKADAARLTKLIRRSNLPVDSPEGMTSDQYLTAMYRDKKVDAGTLKLILLKQLGHAFITSEFSQDDLLATLNHFCR